MPKTPKGAKRPADVISNAVMVMRIATGEIDESLTDDGKSKAAVELGRKGGEARAKALGAHRRKVIARAGAAARWKPPSSISPGPAQPTLQSNTASKTPAELLLEILDPEAMSDEEQSAVWTLLKYLKKQNR